MHSYLQLSIRSSMITTITIIHNQESNLDRILQAYADQSQQPEIYVFVLDRCTDKSKEKVEKFVEFN